jgi:hypothetical protein
MDGSLHAIALVVVIRSIPLLLDSRFSGENFAADYDAA